MGGKLYVYPALIPNRWKALSSHHLSTFPRDDIIWDYAGRLEYNIYNKKHVFLKRQWELAAWCFWLEIPGVPELFPHCDPSRDKATYFRGRHGSGGSRGCTADITGDQIPAPHATPNTTSGSQQVSHQAHT